MESASYPTAGKSEDAGSNLHEQGEKGQDRQDEEAQDEGKRGEDGENGEGEEDRMQYLDSAAYAPSRFGGIGDYMRNKRMKM